MTQARARRLRTIESFSLDVEQGAAIIYTAGRRVDVGIYGLAVLAAFAQERSVAEVVQELGSHAAGPTEWMQISSTILRLANAGLLIEPSGTVTPPRNRTVFTSPYAHIAMLNDARRTGAYLQAIRQVVRPDSIVLDIGTGTGVLATAAAGAGAEHVYAIDAATGSWARAVAKANGLADRVTVLDGWSARIELPHRANMLITETLGDDPLSERMLETVIDARQRLLQPDAITVPAVVRIVAVPVQIPAVHIANRRFSSALTSRWGDAYGIEFSPLLQANVEAATMLAAHPSGMGDWRELAEPTVVASVPLATILSPVIDASATVSASYEGVCNAVVVYFEADLCEGVTLALRWHDRTSDPDWSWSYAVWLLAHPFAVLPGVELQLRYRYRVPNVEERHRVLCTPRDSPAAPGRGAAIP
jgi:SAM-dependent methyltransferase